MATPTSGHDSTRVVAEVENVRELVQERAECGRVGGGARVAEGRVGPVVRRVESSLIGEARLERVERIRPCEHARRAVDRQPFGSFFIHFIQGDLFTPSFRLFSVKQIYFD